MIKKTDIAVIIGYFNGAMFIKDQLESILKQSCDNTIFIFNDNCAKSTELYCLIEKNYSDKVKLYNRCNTLGFSKNFLQALSELDSDYSYYAFSDQDDIWNRDKLKKAIFALKELPINEPSLYCARTEIVDATCNQTLGYSPLFNKPPSFANALVQNIGGGNTMVFNKTARNLIVEASKDVTVVSHDWWCYQLVTGAGGHALYDSKPCLKYRQHDNNIVGSNVSWRSRVLRIRDLMRGRFREWNDINLAALYANYHLLTKSNQRVINDFAEARQSSLIKRLILFKRSGIYRQTFIGNLGLLLGVLLKKV